jgi:hypothetical protein
MQFLLSRAARYISGKRKEIEAMRGDTAYVNLLIKLSKFKGGQYPVDSRTSQANSTQNTTPCQLIVKNTVGVSAKTSATATTGSSCGCTLTQSSALTSTSTSMSVVVSPLLQTEWNQNAPYNNLYGGSTCGTRYDDCYSSSNDNYYAGCVEVAESQVIAYFYGKNPSLYGSDWVTIANTPFACSATLNPTQISEVASLVHSVRLNYPIVVESCVDWWIFNFQNTFTFPIPDEGICPTFGMVQGNWRGYGSSGVLSSLSAGSPVPVYGSENLLCLNLLIWDPCVIDPTAYHEWVIDGYENLNTNSTYTIFPVDYDNCTKLPPYQVSHVTATTVYDHSNWGWGGQNNGWYVDGAFGGAGYITGGATSDPNTTNNYNHGDNMMINVHPN